MTAEISYDLVMEDEMHFVEGAFRLCGGPWQVFIFSRDAVEKAEVRPCKWQNGVSGVFVRFPTSAKLNAIVAQQVLSDHLGVSEWVEVRGPDSMQLR